MQNFCQFTVRCVAISAQAFKCSIWKAQQDRIKHHVSISVTDILQKCNTDFLQVQVHTFPYQADQRIVLQSRAWTRCDHTGTKENALLFQELFDSTNMGV